MHVLTRSRVRMIRPADLKAELLALGLQQVVVEQIHGTSAFRFAATR